MFKYGYETGVIDKPVRFGLEFKKPSASVLRRHRAKNGQRFLEAEECHKLLDKATQPLEAMILLGLNCGFGNHDCAELRFTRDNGEKVLNLDTGWLNFPRPKTGIESPRSAVARNHNGIEGRNSSTTRTENAKGKGFGILDNARTTMVGARNCQSRLRSMP